MVKELKAQVTAIMLGGKASYVFHVSEYTRLNDI
jgi:hypothetical protein